MAQLDYPIGYSELSPADEAQMRDLIKLYIARGVPDEYSFYINLDNSPPNGVTIESGTRSAPYTLYIFGWQPYVVANVFDIARQLGRIRATSGKMLDVAEWLHAYDERLSISERIKTGNIIKLQHDRMSSRTGKIYDIINDPRNWLAPPNASAIFVWRAGWED